MNDVKFTLTLLLLMTPAIVGMTYTVLFLKLPFSTTFRVVGVTYIIQFVWFALIGETLREKGWFES